jgi:phosphoribosylformylglycinamidine synthase
MALVTVEVHLKNGVTDPEGDATAKALKLLGFDGISKVRFVKRFDLEVAEADPAKARAAAEEMCRRLLANPVIHDFTIRVA